MVPDNFRLLAIDHQLSVFSDRKRQGGMPSIRMI